MLKGMLDFILKSKTAFNAVENTKKILLENGYKEIDLNDTIGVGKYFITRNDSSIIAFNIPENIDRSINVICTHTDSPCFKIKPSAKGSVISVEPYGGAIYSSWLDRPLSFAGRVMVEDNNKIKSVIFSVDKNTLIMPNLCIHFNKDINNGYKYDPKKDLRPLVMGYKNIEEAIKDNTGYDMKDIVSYDMFVCNNEAPTLVGDTYMSPRIDNLSSHFISLSAFLSSNDTFKVFASFDSEEVGSRSMQGAASTFLYDTLERIYLDMGMSTSDLKKNLQRGIIISADNAHAVNKNYSEMYDGVNAPELNLGFVIKYNASLSYTTDSISAAIIKKLCKDNNIMYQEFTNRADIRGGSTLGNILQQSISIHMVDVGLPQLAMHSAYETAGVNDIKSYYEMMRAYYNSNIIIENDEIKL